MEKTFFPLVKSIIFSILLISGIQLNGKSIKNFPTKLKTSLNAYSFSKPLLSGEMSLDQLIEFCALNQIDAVDLTAYYFPGYPEVPSDEYLYHIKQKAFLLGVEISGTGVRNDFTEQDPAKLKASVDLVKKWIIAAEKIGAPVIRVFSGAADPKGLSRAEAVDQVVRMMSECVAFGKAHGVVVAIQNHNDFIKTADQAIEIIQRINSEWCGLILDIGSYRTGDPYKEIAQSIPFAVNWQLKENLFVNGIEQNTDLNKLLTIIQASGYRGYLPLETLGEGDPKIKVPLFLKEIRTALKEIGQ
ncbi:MAG: sugar phosphate isomerase/epimerase [Bacteroidia bacterium]|nr:sugar phosphate isomerase/epimerase [Bacteroidia bacterium]